MNTEHKNIDAILHDLYEVDQTLQNFDGDIRVIVATLLEHKPQVTIDSTFVATLRKELVAHTSAAPIPTPFDELLGLWAPRLMPVAALALIMLILIPSGSTPRPTPQNLPYTAPYQKSAPSLGSQSLESTSLQAPDTRSDIRVQHDTFMEADTMNSNAFGAPVRTDETHITVDGVTLTAPSFLIIHDDREGTPNAVIGISPLIGPGAIGTISITLTTPTTLGNTYHISLFADDGDGIFTINRDTQVIDPQIGNPISVPFVAE